MYVYITELKIKLIVHSILLHNFNINKLFIAINIHTFHTIVVLHSKIFHPHTSESHSNIMAEINAE